MNLSILAKLLVAGCTILGCFGQIFMSGQDFQDARKELKESRAKSKESKNDTETEEV